MKSPDIKRLHEAIELAVNCGYWTAAVVAWGNSEGIGGTVCHGSMEGVGGCVLSPTSLFDIASITKVLSVGIGMARCHQDHALSLDMPIRHWPGICNPDWSDELTIRHLVTHTSGFNNRKPPGHLQGQKALKAWLNQPLVHPPGTHFEYACINLVILGLILEKITGKTLAEQLEDNLTKPLELTGLGYGPFVDPTGVVPTRPELCGVINDPPARQIGVPVGNAGIFASSNHLGQIATHLLAKLKDKPSNLPLTKKTIQWMIEPVEVGNVVDRAVCWDRNSPTSVHDKPHWASGRAVGHSGWTGHSFWIDGPWC